MSTPPYSDSDSMAVGEEVPVEGGGKESRDKRVDRDNIVSDGGGIGTGDGDWDAGSLVCSRYWSRSSMIIERNTRRNVGYT